MIDKTQSGRPMRESARERLVRMTQIEGAYWSKGVFPGGSDEAGRGPLVGPVVAACVVMPPEPLLLYINDSKKIAPKRRESLYDEIIQTALGWAIEEASVEEIAQFNIRNASRLAMERAVERVRPGHLLVDYEKNLKVSCSQEAFVGGDAVSYNIAAASILAKVYRDRLMKEIDAEYPMYGFSRNKGYGTPEHLQALKQYGPCPLHRELFVRKYTGGALE